MSYTIHVQPSLQKLFLYKDGCFVKSYTISTAKKGIGQKRNSNQTPEGWHEVRAKIGDGLPTNAVLVGRRWTKEIFSDTLQDKQPNRDWILTRILWLSGLEHGKNRIGDVDTMARYIYIHGVPDKILASRPASQGCIGLSSKDVLEIFDLISPYTKVYIGERFNINS